VTLSEGETISTAAVQETADALGISRSHLWKKTQKCDIERGVAGWAGPIGCFVSETSAGVGVAESKRRGEAKRLRGDWRPVVTAGIRFEI
jgi:hypothetical protein